MDCLRESRGVFLWHTKKLLTIWHFKLLAWNLQNCRHLIACCRLWGATILCLDLEIFCVMSGGGGGGRKWYSFTQFVEGRAEAKNSQEKAKKSEFIVNSHAKHSSSSAMVLLKLAYVNVVTNWAAWEWETLGNLKICSSRKIQDETGFTANLGHTAVHSAGRNLRG